MITFIVCAFNEEKNILNTINEIENACNKNSISEYEIICIDDGSIDNTYSILNNLNSSNIRIIKNIKNLGYGASVKVGAKEANKEYITWIPGDNSHPASEISKLLVLLKKYDIISTFYSNSHERDSFRRLFTSFYTPILNFVFQKKLPYYNGVTMIKKKIFLDCNIQTNSHAFSLEMWINIFLSNKYSFIFIPTILTDRIEGASAFRLSNSVKVLYATFRLIFFYLRKKYLRF
tara:strand:+ start:1006 stop:1704 length:699 start_codon:yes stop_codon:yes gene_type:complete